MGTVIVIALLVTGFIYLNVKNGWMFPWAMGIYTAMLIYFIIVASSHWLS